MGSIPYWILRIRYQKIIADCSRLRALESVERIEALRNGLDAPELIEKFTEKKTPSASNY